MKNKLICLIAFAMPFPTMLNAVGPLKETIKINPTSEKHVTIQQISDQVEFLPIITEKNIFLNEVSKIIDSDSSFFLFSRTTPGIYQFNKKGVMQKSITDVGKGPGQINNPLDVCLTNNRLIVLQNRLLIIYDHNLNYKNSIKLPFFASRIESVNDKKLILYLNNYHITHFQAIVELNGDNISQILYFQKKPNTLTRYCGTQPRNYQKISDQVIFSSLWSDTVFNIKDTTLYTRWIIDFGKYKLLPNTYTKISKDPYTASQELENSGKAHRVENFIESDKYLVFQYCFGNRKPKQVIVNKSSHDIKLNGYVYDEKNEPIELDIIGTFNNKIAILLDVDDLLLLKKSTLTNDMNGKWKDLFKTIDTLDENSNPILLYF